MWKLAATGYRVRLTLGALRRRTQGASARLRGNVTETDERRRLEIGPGDGRIPGFETLDVVRSPDVDYVADAAGVLPFDDGTFDLVYASHVLEHIAWFRTQDTLQEWVRVLKPGGRLEIWVPDGLKICAAFVAAEAGECDPLKQDPWYRFNPQGDPCLWANGRVFTYGDGSTDYSHPNWHRALFSERCLGILLTRAGLEDVGRLEPAAIRGNDHGWINLGMTGVKSA